MRAMNQLQPKPLLIRTIGHSTRTLEEFGALRLSIS